GDPARRRFVRIPVLYPDEAATRPVVVWVRRGRPRPFETGPSGSADRDGALLDAPVVGLLAGEPDVDDLALDPQPDVSGVAPAVPGHLEARPERDEPRVHRAPADAGRVAA